MQHSRSDFIIFFELAQEINERQPNNKKNVLRLVPVH